MSRKKLARYLAYIPAVMWMIMIFSLSSVPSLSASSNPTFDFAFKKTAHVSVYFVLFFLLWLPERKRDKSSYIKILLICLAFAVSDEIHQMFVPGRHPHIKDVGFDSLGYGVASLISSKIKL